MAAAGLAGLAVSGCAGSRPSTNGPQKAVFEYTCCSAKDMDAIYRPGQTLVLHWIAVSSPATSATNTISVKLTANLSGPFADVSAAKRSSGSPAAVRAATLNTTEQTRGAPISRIAIPASAPSGYFNLTTRVDDDGNIVRGTGTIHVLAR